MPRRDNYSGVIVSPVLTSVMILHHNHKYFIIEDMRAKHGWIHVIQQCTWTLVGNCVYARC